MKTTWRADISFLLGTRLSASLELSCAIFQITSCCRFYYYSHYVVKETVLWKVEYSQDYTVCNGSEFKPRLSGLRSQALFHISQEISSSLNFFFHPHTCSSNLTSNLQLVSTLHFIYSCSILAIFFLVLTLSLLLLLLLLSRFSCVRLCATPWTAAYLAPPPVGFSRQEYWSGVPLPSLNFELRLFLFIYFVNE